MSFQNDHYDSISSSLRLTQDKNSSKNIILYIDVYRGLAVVYMLLITSQQSFSSNNIYDMFILSKWNDISIADLAPSLFIFIMGACVYYSMTQSLRENTGKIGFLLKKIFKRFFLLIIIGLFLNYIYRPLFDFATLLTLRIPSYLGRIAFCYLILCLGHISGVSYLVSIVAIFFFLYIFFTHLFLVPFCGLNNITPFCFCGSFFDQSFFTKYHSTYPNDPQGVLGSFSALYTAFNGYLISHTISENKLSIKYSIIAIILIDLCNLIPFSIFYCVFNIPINASIYSSSFACLASIACTTIYLLLYCLFHFKRINRFVSKTCGPLIWLGKNSIMIYILSEIIHCIFARVMVNNISLSEIILSKIVLILEKNNKLGGLIYSVIIIIVWVTLAYLVHLKKYYFKLK